MTDLYGHAVVVLDDPTEEDWIEARHHGIGASETAAVMGLSDWESNVEVWARKTGSAASWEGNEAADLGHLFEEVIARAAAGRLGLEIIGPPMSQRPEREGERSQVLLQHPDLPFMLCSPDRIARDKQGRVGPLEIKMTAGPTASEAWESETLQGGALAAALQVTHQQIVTGHQIGWVGALVGGYGHRIETRTLHYDQGTAEAVTAKVADLWQHVEDGTMPKPNKASAITTIEDVLNGTQPGTQELDSDTIALVDQLQAAKDEAKAADERVKLLKAEVAHALALADCEVGLVDGAEYVTWRKQSATRVKPDRVKAAFGAWAWRFGETTTNRVMRTPQKRSA